MATMQSPTRVSYEAGADLSALQFHFVSMSADGQVDGSGDGAVVLGVLLNAPDEAGKVAEIATAGVVKVVAGGSIEEGNEIGSDTNSEAVAAATGDYRIGIALTPASAGEIFEMQITHAGV